MNTTVTVALAIGAVVVLVAAVALRVADRLGLPSLLLYLALGLALGESGLGRRSSRTPSSPRTSASPRWSSSWPRAG